MKWRCGVSGLGVGEQHAKAYLKDPRCVLEALFDTDRAKLEEVGARFPGVELIENWDHLLEHAELDVLSVASPEDAHCKQVVGALNNGWHVFAEKPLCQTLQELDSIRTTAQRTGHCVLTNLVLRSAPAFCELRRMIAAGELGEIYAFDGDYLYGRLWKITEGWRGRLPFYSVMQGGGVHLIDLMHWCLGEMPVSVQTHGNLICTRGSQFRYPDMQAATFQFASGAIGRVTANFGCVLRHQHFVRVFGTKGTFVSDESGPRVVLQRDGQTRSLSNFPSLPSSKGALLPEFLEVLEKKPMERQKAMDSHFATMLICLASDESMASGDAVKINYE